MSKLEFYNRPLISFDPANEEHRRYYYEFLKYDTWGRCPYRFIVQDAHRANLVAMIQQKLLDWYVMEEFDRVSKVNQKRKKTVDNMIIRNYTKLDANDSIEFLSHTQEK